MERFDQLGHQIMALLESDNIDEIKAGFVLAEEFSSIREDDEIRSLTLKSNLYSQWALTLVKAGELERGYAFFYTLLKWDLNLPAWKSNMDKKPRDRHLGESLERCDQFLNWIEGLNEEPQVPEELAKYKIDVPEKPDERLLLVAGLNNYTGLNQAHEDTFAPGRRARIAALLHWGANINAKDSYKETSALHHLAALEDADSIRYCVSRGADVGVLDKENKTPLFWVADRKNSSETIRALIDAGVAVDAAAKNGRTALFDAAYSGSAEGVKTLVELGADPNFDAGPGSIPLELAARSSNIASAKALLESGAKPAQSALNTAESEKYFEMAALLKDALGIAPPKSDTALADIKVTAEEVGKAAALEAVDGGDYGYYKDEDDLDVSQLGESYWDDNFEGVVQEAIDALPQASQNALPEPAELMPVLKKIYLEAFYKAAESD